MHKVPHFEQGLIRFRKLFLTFAQSRPTAHFGVRAVGAAADLREPIWETAREAITIM
ncbi:hypothetical protein thsrh120_55610 [Rhizobium sp. No.120]